MRATGRETRAARCGGATTMITADMALVLAQRAARFILTAHVTRVLLHCRADLPAETRRRMERGAMTARHRGLALAARFDVRQHYVIVEEELRRGSVGVARYQMRKEQCSARDFTTEVVERALERAWRNPAAAVQGAQTEVRLAA